MGGRVDVDVRSSLNPTEDEFKEPRWKKESINTKC